MTLFFKISTEKQKRPTMEPLSFYHTPTLQNYQQLPKSLYAPDKVRGLGNASHWLL